MTHIMPPYLIILRKLDETNDIKLPVHFADNVNLWTRRVEGIRFGICDAKVDVNRSQRLLSAVEDRRILRFMLRYLIIRMSHVASADRKSKHGPARVAYRRVIVNWQARRNGR